MLGICSYSGARVSVFENMSMEEVIGANTLVFEDWSPRYVVSVKTEPLFVDRSRAQRAKIVQSTCTTLIHHQGYIRGSVIL